MHLPVVCMPVASVDDWRLRPEKSRMRWIDTHCHLDAPEFARDATDVRARARAAGVGSCRSISIELTSCFWYDELAPCASIFPEWLLWIDGVVTTSALGPPCPVSSCVDSEDLEEVIFGGCVVFRR